MSEQLHSRKAVGLARLLLGIGLIAVCAGASAESRTGTTVLGLRVERHAGVVLPPPPSDFAPLALRGPEGSDSARAFGNGEPALMVSTDASALAPSSSREPGSRPRARLTIFEP